jgi:hypothetical protein
LQLPDHLNFRFIAVDEKNSLDSSTGKDVNLDQFIKPPANLVVLEGDCLDTGGDGGELESYLVYLLLASVNLMVFCIISVPNDMMNCCSCPPLTCTRILFYWTHRMLLQFMSL